MSFRSCALALAVLVAAAAPALAHEGNPNFLSTVTGITPGADGVTVEVLNRDDRLLLHNTSGRDVVVEGYDREPYIRLLADGTVQVNEDSKAHYLNDDRFGKVKTPASADSKGAPKWVLVDRTGRYEWHDHRMHWMSEQPPEAVKGVEQRMKVFDWSVPVEIGGTRGAIAGSLFWTPRDDGGPPTAAIAGLAAFVLASLVLVVVVRRRRRADGTRAAAGREPAEVEAW
jgi:hypothetical protein